LFLRKKEKKGRKRREGREEKREQRRKGEKKGKKGKRKKEGENMKIVQAAAWGDFFSKSRGRPQTRVSARVCGNRGLYHGGSPSSL
jgi:hypothetical protein